MPYKLPLRQALGLARLVLNRPERRNCIDAEFTREFREAAIVLDENPAVHAVLLSAAGEMDSAVAGWQAPAVTTP